MADQTETSDPSESSETSESDQLDAVRKIMGSVRTCMLTTVASDGSLQSAPMTVLDTEYDGTAWFIAGAGSDTVAHLKDNPTVNLSYAGDSSWLSLSGKATVSDDAAKKEELWNTFVEAWFPDGPSSPASVLVEVDGDSAQYWDSKGKLVTLAAMVKAKVTHSTPNSGDSGSVEL